MGTVTRRRIWSEFLPASELGDRATITLLQRFDLEPVVALPPRAQTRDMARALAMLSAAGLRVGIWPLLDDDEGYWPSEVNAAAFCARVAETLAFARGAGARATTVAVDLEPSLGLVRRLLDGTMRERGALIVDAFEGRKHDEQIRARVRAEKLFSELAGKLANAGIESLAVMAPPVVLDLASGTRFWQEFLRTPLVGPGWSVVSPLVYTSMIGAALPRPLRSRAGVLVYEIGRLLARARARACMSLGVVTHGKLGDETAFTSPAELDRDVQCALVAGISDLALFSLEGVLRRGSPESWLVPFTGQGPLRPRDPVSHALSLLTRATGHAAMTLARGLNQ